MKFETNKEKGNSGLIAAIGYYGMLGYTISLPLNDTQDYDLVVDNGEKLLKIQIKATAQRSPQGYTVVSVKSCGGTKGKTYKTVKETNIDFLFVLTELQEMYEIPIEEVQSISSMSLGPERQCFRVDNIDNFYFLKKKEKTEKTKFYCNQCGKEISNKGNTGLCLQCYNFNNRTVERPNKQQLLKELQESNFTQVGKKYGVSDNSIRKWCVAYGLPRTIKEIKNFTLET